MRTLVRPIMHAGIAAIVFGLGILHSTRYDYGFSEGGSRIVLSSLLVLVLSLSAYGAGLPDIPRTGRSAWLSSAAAAGTGALLVSIAQLFLGDQLLPRLVVLGSAMTVIPWYRACAGISVGSRSRAERRDQVFVVADLSESKGLIDELDLAPWHPAKVVGVMSMDEVGRGQVTSLEAQIKESGATVLVLSRSAQVDERVLEQAGSIHESGVRVRTLMTFYEAWMGKLPISELERLSLFWDIRELHGTRYRRVKRLADALIGIIGMVPLALVLPLVALGNLFGNKGSLFFRQIRVGKGGRHFEILKFRSMLPGTASVTSLWTTADDPRVTSFGSFLRRSHIDELPQVVNLILGNLSIVGPRPEQPHYVERLEQLLPFYRFRHLVNPGLTGWAQVNYGYAGSDEDALEKLQYDFYYLRHQSAWLDARIIIRTIRSILGLVGR